MAGKVKVSRELSVVLESLMKNCTGNDLMRFYFACVQTIPNELTNEEFTLSTLEPLQLASILLNGYEIEETPEDKILADYKGKSPILYGQNGEFYQWAVRNTLDTLGIKIKGINE